MMRMHFTFMIIKQWLVGQTKLLNLFHLAWDVSNYWLDTYFRNTADLSVKDFIIHFFFA